MKMNEDDYEQEESSSRHLLGAVEELLQRSHHQFISKRRQRIPYRSKSLDNLFLHRSNLNLPESSISQTTTTQFDLSTLDFDDTDELPIQRCRSAPIFTVKIYDQELAPFLHGEHEQGVSQTFADNFVYNIDLSCSNNIDHDDDDPFSNDEVTNESFVSLLQSPLLKTCLTITEENEEELEEIESTQSSPDSIDEEMPERLATIYESPSPQPILDENPSRKHSDDHSLNDFSSSPVISNANIPSSNTKEQTLQKSSTISNHIQIMKMIPSSTSNLSDFISPSPPPPAPSIITSSMKINPMHYEEISSVPPSTSSSDTLSSIDEKSRAMLSTSNILFPIDYSKENSTNYRQILTEMSLIKTKLMNIEIRLNETMRELEIEQALIEGEHDLVFKQILNATEDDQEKIQRSHEQFQLLMQHIMTDKLSIRKQIEATQQILVQLEIELQTLDDEYRSSDENIMKKKQFIVETQTKYEDLEFQLMELETRCEVELERAEEHFHKERQLVSENAQLRQNLLRDLDHQQYMVMCQVSMEKERLEREKRRLNVLFEAKKLQANQCEEQLINAYPIYQSIEQKLLSTPKSPSTRSRIGPTNDLEIKLRDRNRIQERPLTRYLPIRSNNFDLRAHIEGAGHCLETPHIHLTSTSCRGFLYKIGGLKLKLWNRRWFVFDRQRRSFSYYHDKHEIKQRGSIDFQSIVEIYVDHLQSNLLRLPVPREATFVMKTHERTFYLIAPTVEAMRIWVDVLITGAEGNTFAGQN